MGMHERTGRRASPAENYRRLWRSGPRPDLNGFLVSHTDLSHDELLDLIETDRSERWQRGDRVKAEHYLEQFPTIAADDEATLVIIYGEFYLRRELGDAPNLMEYIARFPQHARRLRDQVMWHEAISSDSSFDSILDTMPEIPGLAIGDRLGRGGMSSVYHAIELPDARDVAVKMIDHAHLNHPLRVARFRREIASTLRLSHPNIVSAFRTGEARGLPYLVMEYCVGGPLTSQLRGRPVPNSLARNLMMQLASAVDYAHQQGVIHRDLKTSNVLLAAIPGQPKPNPTSLRSTPLEVLPYIPKLSDFGLAKSIDGGDGSITATRETLGTPCYMAPELTIGARDADVRTDVYGLGSILYELLTGRPPFVARAPLEVLRMVREETPIPPTYVNPEVWPELEYICLKCLQKEPDHRFQSAHLVYDSLESVDR
jgi:hypothetical protein